MMNSQSTPEESRRRDVDIAYDAIAALTAAADVPENRIRAWVQDRWLWLVGEADDEAQRAAAERAVKDIQGTKGLTNLVRIKRH